MNPPYTPPCQEEIARGVTTDKKWKWAQDGATSKCTQQKWGGSQKADGQGAGGQEKEDRGGLVPFEACGVLRVTEWR